MKSFEKYLFIFLIFNYLSSFSQENIKPTVKLVYDSIKWEKYSNWSMKKEYIDDYDTTALFVNELNRDTSLINSFLKSNFYKIVDYTNDTTLSPTSRDFNELLPYLYTIDFNGDDLLDVFYQGFSGADPYITKIFMNKGTSFQKVFSGYSSVLNMEFVDTKLRNFTLIFPGCCADPQIMEYSYNVNYNEKIPQFIKTKSVGYLRCTQKVKNPFPRTKDIEINKDGVKIRYNCYILDNTEHPVWGSEGNIIAKYNKGAKGFALGEMKEDQQVWVYVLMNSDSKYEKCEFATFEEQPTEIYGWLLKKDITVLSENK